MIDAKPENLTTSITMSPMMKTVSNSTEQAAQGGTSYHSLSNTQLNDYARYVMENIENMQTTVRLFNSTESDPPETTQQAINLNGNYEI